MKCLICNTTFYVKRDLRTLFRRLEKNRCPSCEKRYSHRYQFETIPIEWFLLHRYFYFKEEVTFTIDAYDDYFKIFLMEHLEALMKGSLLIVVESLSDELLHILDLLKFSHIYIYSLYVLEI